MNEALQEAAFAEYTAALEMYRVRQRLYVAEDVVLQLKQEHESAQRRYEDARQAVLDLARADLIAAETVS